MVWRKTPKLPFSSRYHFERRRSSPPVRGTSNVRARPASIGAGVIWPGRTRAVTTDETGYRTDRPRPAGRPLHCIIASPCRCTWTLVQPPWAAAVVSPLWTEVDVYMLRCSRPSGHGTLSDTSLLVWMRATRHARSIRVLQVNDVEAPGTQGCPSVPTAMYHMGGASARPGGPAMTLLGVWAATS